MIEVSMMLSANTGGDDAVTTIAGWLAMAMQENPIDGMLVHRLEVEVVDA